MTRSPEPDTPPNGSSLRPLGPRFTLTAMLLVMLVMSVAAACASYLIRGLQGGRPAQLVALMVIVAAPLLLVVVVSVVRELLLKLRRK